MTSEQRKEVLRICDRICERLEVADIFTVDLDEDSRSPRSADDESWDEALRILSGLGWDADRAGAIVTVKNRPGR